MWKIKPTAVYYTIVDHEDNLICFMSITDKDYNNAQLIIEAVNKMKRDSALPDATADEMADEEKEAIVNLETVNC